MKMNCLKWKTLLISGILVGLQGISCVALPTPPKTTWDKMWEIQLINGDNLISEDVTGPFVTFDGQSVDARCGDFYQDMADAAAEEGITLYLRSGHRTISEQVGNYNAAVNRYMGYGYSYATSVSIANKYYAPPRGSEHNIALAFDIITPEYHRTVYNLTSKFAQTEAYAWLIEHCADFGFILRYPGERIEDTGINFEPWHYRYVGVEHAQYITEHDLILEEYVALYQETYPELYEEAPPEEPTFPDIFDMERLERVSGLIQTLIYNIFTLETKIHSATDGGTYRTPSTF